MKEKKMKEKKKRSEKKKKVPMRESNPRPLNLQPAVTTTELPPQGLIARTILTYCAFQNSCPVS